ncbi:GM19464 [Drosophila sechellia]|uniref:GM19464 n=1 Tax=Drosophila sechellia TaxID=7238 RepID=B4HN32_DROSE|nr:GM19464 [Drosophila sechellia]
MSFAAAEIFLTATAKSGAAPNIRSSKAAKAATVDIFACGLWSYANWHSKQSAAKSSGGLPCATCHLPPALVVGAVAFAAVVPATWHWQLVTII